MTPHLVTPFSPDDYSVLVKPNNNQPEALHIASTSFPLVQCANAHWF